MWHRLMDGYGKLGVYTSVDQAILIIFCELWSNYVETTKSGGLFPAPHLGQLRLLAGSLGLDPASRQKLTSMPKEDKKDADPWDDL